jgi:hypothetical protein
VGAGRGAGHREKLQVAAQSQSGTVVVHAAEEGRGRPMVVLAVAAEVVVVGGVGRDRPAAAAFGGLRLPSFFFLLRSVVDSLTRWALEDASEYLAHC